MIMNEEQTQAAGEATLSSSGVGRWFYARYGFDVVVGHCVARTRDGGYVLRFRWGGPWRETFHVLESAILAEAEDPRWISRLRRMFKRERAAGAE
jgi:hypothetical protein